jgi:hypothetical protein
VPIGATAATYSSATATATTSVLSFASLGNPAVASQGSRLATMRLAIECRQREVAATEADGLPAPPDFQSNPLSFALPSEFARNEAVALHGGSIIVNAAFLLVFTLGSMAVALIRKIVCRSSLPRAMAWARSPGVVLFPAMYTVQPVALSATIMVSYGTVGPIAMGSAVLVGLGATITAGCLTFRGTFWRNFQYEVHKGDGATDGSQGPRPGVRWRRIFSWLLRSPGDWGPSAATVTAAGQDPGAATVNIRRFGVLFDPYGPRHAWFLAVEVGYLVVSGVASGLAAAAGCLAAAWAGAFLTAAYAAALVTMRPHSSHVDVVLQCTLAVLQAAGSLLAATATTVNDQDVASALESLANAAVTASAMGAIVIAIYELVKAIYQQVTRRVRGIRARSLAAEAERRSALRSGAQYLAGAVDFDDPLLAATSAEDDGPHFIVASTSLSGIEPNTSDYADDHSSSTAPRRTLNDEFLASLLLQTTSDVDRLVSSGARPLLEASPLRRALSTPNHPCDPRDAVRLRPADFALNTAAAGSVTLSNSASAPPRNQSATSAIRKDDDSALDDLLSTPPQSVSTIHLDLDLLDLL